MFPNDFIEKQKVVLQREKLRLEDDVKKLKKYPEYGDLPDDNDMELRDFETNMSIDDNLEVVLKSINKALEAIENGNYGKCKKCNEQIEKGRLKIMPYAALCITCQSKK